MPNLTCERCGEGFWQGQGRPAKRCPPCRGDDRYGPQHRAVKAAGPTYGQPCTRCGLPLLPGQATSPDHLDGGGPTDYAGWAHASCNVKAGAVRGNQLRAQAYNALKASILTGTPPPAEALNGSPPAPEPSRRADAPGRCERPPGMTDEERLHCICGRHSRCW